MNSIYANYKNRFITLKGLKLPDLPKELEISGEKFVVKPEFHITLLAVGQIAEIIGGDIKEVKTALVNDFEDFTDRFPLSQYELSGGLRLVNASGNNTIIAMVKLEGIEKLFETLSKKYGVELPVQPAHITLYTSPTHKFGIPILSYKELEDLSEPIDIAKLQSLL